VMLRLLKVKVPSGYFQAGPHTQNR
jgi:hypothetical protein